jgi:hypothetical protein
LRREHCLKLIARLDSLDDREHEIRSFFGGLLFFARVDELTQETIVKVNVRRAAAIQRAANRSPGRRDPTPVHNTWQRFRLAKKAKSWKMWTESGRFLVFRWGRSVR